MIYNDNTKLFKYGDDLWVTCGDFRQALKKVGAQNCKVLFLHTQLSFGSKNKELKRKDLCKIIYDLIMELGVESVVFPTFTFSYGNKEDFDVRNTPTKMGVLNEYVRKLPNAKRSLDPMMSVVVFGKENGLLDITGRNSIGVGSIFDVLHHTNDVKFLFLGTRLGMCGTHMHYVEERLQVPYRYNMDFYGKMIDYAGNVTEEHRILYVKYRDILPQVPVSFEDGLVDSGIMKYIPLGNSGIYCITEKDMYRKIYSALSSDVNAFLAEPYNTHKFVKDYHYGNVTTVQ